MRIDRQTLKAQGLTRTRLVDGLADIDDLTDLAATLRRYGDRERLQM